MAADSKVVPHPSGYTGPERRAVTRSEAISAAVRAQLAERAALLDKAEDLGEITITVKIQAGTTWIRGVVWQEERVCRQRR